MLKRLIWGLWVSCCLLAACSAEPEINTTPIAVATTMIEEASTPLPTPTLQGTTAPPDATPTATTRPTNTPTVAVSPTATNTPTQTPTATNTPTPTMTPTPEGGLDFVVHVLSKITEKPIVGAEVGLISASETYDKVSITLEEGYAPFSAVPREEAHILSVEMTGFLPLSRTISADMLTEPLTVYLIDTVNVTITRINIHVRTGPNVDYESLGLAIPEETYRVVGISADSEWLLIDTDFPVNSWVKLLPNTMKFRGDVDALPVVNQ